MGTPNLFQDKIVEGASAVFQKADWHFKNVSPAGLQRRSSRR
jgi:hypothetical protein